MNKDDFVSDNKEENNIPLFLIKSALSKTFRNNSNIKKENDSNDNSNDLNKFFIQNLDNIINFIKQIDNIYNYIYKPKSKLYHKFKRNIRYIYKLALNRKDILFKEKKINKIEYILSIFITFIGNYLNEKKHQKIKKILLIIIRLTTEKVFPSNFFSIIIEILINLLIDILNSNPDFKYSLNDEPFILISDIIDSLIIYPKEIKIENSNNYILTDIISLFDKYLISQNYINISFRESSIWLRLLENRMVNPLPENDIENDNNTNNDDNVNNENNKNTINDDNKKTDIDDAKKNILKKIITFLIKIYRFSMRDEYFQNYIMKKGIINLKYYINSINYLLHLFNEEEKLQSEYSFKIINGFKIQKDNFIFLPNIKLKISDFSLIFSFNITQISKDIDNIIILNIYNKPNKSILKIFLDSNSYLNILYNEDKKWETFIKIQENKFYLVCIALSKTIMGSKLCLFINEDKVKDNNNKGVEIQNTDSCYYYNKKKVHLDFSKEISFELGKNNFIGIIGELLIINKNFTKENIHHLFNLKEKYSKILSQIYNNYDNLYSYDSIIWNKSKFGINKLNDDEKRSISFFKQLGYEIQLEIMTYKINKFTKLKYFSQNFYSQELLNNTIKQINLKDNNEKHLSLVNIVPYKSQNNSLNSSNLYSSNTNNFSISNSSFTNSYTFKKESFIRKKIDINMNIFKLRFSSIIFYQNKGFDFLTLQLHNIISTVKEKEIYDIYLYETISFIYKIMLIMNEDIIDYTQRQLPKLNEKISIFFLTLLTLLNKKKNDIILNHNIILTLLEILDYFRFNQLFAQRNMILSILLEVRYYPNKSDIMKYPKLLKTMTDDLLDDSNNDITIIKVEILYKILMLDFIFELKEYKHKSLMKLISAFITFNKYKKNENSDSEINITNEFINYILSLKNEVKLYHYLKIIYLNINKLKKKLLNNEKFLESINMNMEKINSSHCKYCSYNQILWYLLNEEICIKAGESEYFFHFSPTGFMKNPSSYFIRCIFSQCLSITDENKLRYMKTKSDEIKFLSSILKKNKNKKNTINNNLEIQYAELVGYSKFIPKFRALVDYLNFLFKQQRESNDSKLLNVIKDSYNFIMSLMREICLEKNRIFHSTKFPEKTWSIINTNNFANIINETEQRSKENKLIMKYNEFIQELVCSKVMKRFYYIYLCINCNQAINDIKYFISISINLFFNPFYFNLLSPEFDFQNYKTKNELNNEEKENINQYIITQLFNFLGTELSKSRLTYDDYSQDIILVKNNILLLIYIYQNLTNNRIEINVKFEKDIILFLNFLLDNYFINSKYIFDLNTTKVNKLISNQNKKFIIEIIVDILFILYENNNYDLKYAYLIKGIFINKKLSLKKIDDQYFLEINNKGVCFKFFNQAYLQEICKGEEVPEILYTIYFLYYLCEKLNKYKINRTENNDNTEPIKLINEILSALFKEVKEIYKENSQKIINIRKNIINKYPYKIYKSFMQYISDKNKDNGWTLDKLIKYYEKLIARKEINLERSSYFQNEDLIFKNSGLDTSIDTRNYKANKMKLAFTWKQPFFKSKKSLLNKNNEDFGKTKSQFCNIEVINDKTDVTIEKRKSKSISHQSSKKLLSYNIRKTTITKSQNELNKLIKKVSNSEIENTNSNSNINNSVNTIESSKTILIQSKKVTFTRDNLNNKSNIKEEITILKSNNTNKKEDNKLSNITNKKNEIGQSSTIKTDTTNDNVSDISDEENKTEEYDIKKKLKHINIASKFYRNIFHLSDPKTLKILFNPKEYYFWNKFTLIIKDIIFHHKKFDLITKIFNIKFKDVNLEKSYKSKNNKYYLRYPTKIKNFTCDDFYRPFIKPDINFFKHKLLPISHSYLNKKIFSNNYTEEDNLCKIKFERILPINYDYKPTKKIICELINNSGSIYGNIYFNHAFLLFISDNNSDPRGEKNMTEMQEEFYLYSYFLEERLKTRKKFIIMYFSEIKEIFIRRFCFNYIGYEIFMKDNRSHLFNFFNKNNLKNFLQIMSEKLELSYKNKPNPNNVPFYSHDANILGLSSLNFNINNDINFCVINDPLYAFEKNNYKLRYQKGEISNFKYLLLLNKYASRTYNDNSQYLVFPLLFLDLSKKIKRNLSRAICLNKEDYESKLSFFKDNFSIAGNHFNSHYSTGGYILYYLIRLNPFTFNHIKFQSGHFDAPERIFSSLSNYLSALFSSDENRELVPELFYIYEAFINLNHYNIGYIKIDKMQINDFNSNDENGIIELIINMRQALEKSNIAPWIDNIFGCNQANLSNEDIINIFPLSSYEQFNNLEGKKKELEKNGLSKREVLKKIKDELILLSLGITPVQLFKTNHPLKNTTSKRLYSFFDGVSNNNDEKMIKSLSSKNLNKFIKTYMVNKYHFYYLLNENNNYGNKLIIQSKKNIYILLLYNNDNNIKNNSIIKLELWKKKQVKIEPLSKICCELSPGIFCFCRYIDNSIQIRSEKQSFLYQYKYIITSVEFFSHSETKNNTNNNIIHVNEILFGDEEGYLNLLQIEYEFNIKKQTFQISSDKIKITKEVKAHNSFIQGISYIKRLNIIISYSEEGQITINNAFSFTIINIIELGEKYYIKDIKISEYDLIYIHCLNNINKNEYIKCYTVNGIKATKLKTTKKINNYFINEELMVVYENNLIEFYNLYDLSKEIYTLNPDAKMNEKENQIEIEKSIIYCDFIVKDMKMIIIYKDHDIIIQNIFPLEK